ncbi:cysteine proteinase [Coccomyxa subellipsoidea C-169]|uniref:Cysteine proteinase n=1 Tax=Coccomyxa subellipsoidea (strain C-169) TaxID=574566 RepID=I0YVT7_COCSC|nr:cysteine proteinase [Coccomyxa subellipsoidea C-169]EIE22506.1 cysteine proteinase [Coccomyxa subellipsoidea C-169]|eukprot:XP_005647050.1 cysteine proteinase [Coccomyxa subellipsoidea C-169]
MAAYYLLLVAAALSVLSSTEAGCYRGRPKPVIPPELYHWNDEPTTLLAARHLPRRFDWSDVDGQNLIVSSWGQHQPIYCGSCWVHGTLSMVQDRLKISKKGKGPDVMLGRQSLLNCAAYEGMGAGCDGGDPIDVFRYMAKFGLPDESCNTYSATDHTKFDQSLKHCPLGAVCRNCMPLNDTADTCWAVKSPILYKVKSWGKIETAHKSEQESAMMSEIYQRGPIVCSISTPEDFTYGYRGGIYKDPLNYTRETVDHNVEVTGWGEEHGVPFWIVRNSWGTFWGEMGFFRIERGINSLFLEDSDCWYAEPEHEMEDEVEDGELVGSMYGVLDAKSEQGSERESTTAAPSKLERALDKVRLEIQKQLKLADNTAVQVAAAEAADALQKIGATLSGLKASTADQAAS